MANAALVAINPPKNTNIPGSPAVRRHKHSNAAPPVHCGRRQLERVGHILNRKSAQTSEL